MNVRICKSCTQRMVQLTGFAQFNENLQSPASTVRQFLQSKSSCAKILVVTSTFPKMKTSARFKDDILRTQLSNGDKIAKRVNDVDYSLVRQASFETTVNEKKMK